MAKQKKVMITTPSGIAAYAWFHKPDSGKEYSDDKYKGDLIIDGDTDLSAIEDKVRAFAAEAFPGIDLSELQLPFKSGDDHKNEEFHGKIILRAKSKFKPNIVDSKRKALPKGVEARSGDEVRFVVSLYAYKKTEKVKEGKKVIEVVVYGVSFQLQVVQVIQKNSGGGGLNMLDDIDDGFDASSLPEDDDDDDQDSGETSGKDSADF
ncbi:MAG: DUF2815 family protein [Devosia sp.]|nr:DUF2815 family protein [Devosia sp.]